MDCIARTVCDLWKLNGVYVCLEPSTTHKYIASIYSNADGGDKCSGCQILWEKAFGTVRHICTMNTNVLVYLIAAASEY